VTVRRRARALLARVALRIARLLWRSGVALGLVLGGGYLASLYGQTLNTVTIDVNGVSLVHHTRRSAPADVFRELGIVLGPRDAVALPSDVDLLAGAPIRLKIARPVRVYHDGTATEVYVHDGDLASALNEARVVLGPADELWSPMGRLAAADDLPEAARRQGMSLAAWIEQIRVPQYLAVRRAVTFTVTDDGIPSPLTTTADTVGQALQRASISIYEGDRVVPELGSHVVPGLSVEIERATLVTVDADGRIKALRTRAGSVGELLAEAGIELEGDDRVSPEEGATISVGMHVSVVRVYDEFYVEEVPIPYETLWEANPELELDQKRTASWGREGAMRQQVRVHYENGAEVTRVEEEAWVAREPEDRILEYGTAIFVRQLETPSGTVEYWRKIRMLATSYNAATAGKPVSSPTFGITRLGEPARKGVIAVDPDVISLRQPMYVPGYGVGFAGDTGSAIQNRRVDLCFDDDNLEMWYRWVDVYLLTPVPSTDRITWAIPNQPVERE
jgi:uncharacterized protein YabE (DUF348 family)